MEDLYKLIGQRIKNLRENLQISQEDLAKQMGYSSPATVSHFENGARKISIADLYQITAIFGVSIDYFYSGEDASEKMQYFRLRAKEHVSPSARESVAAFLAFAQKHATQTLDLPFIDTSQPRKAAAGILDFAGINNPPVSLNQIADKLGISIFYWEFPDTVSGIFVSNEGYGCIGVNQNHPYTRQRFTISHELGHLIFHSDHDLFVDATHLEIAEISLDENQRYIETTANLFAADLLMPQKWLREDFKKYGSEGILFMAQKYEVSEQAMWFRLQNLKLVE